MFTLSIIVVLGIYAIFLHFYSISGLCLHLL